MRRLNAELQACQISDNTTFETTQPLDPNDFTEAPGQFYIGPGPLGDNLHDV